MDSIWCIHFFHLKTMVCLRKMAHRLLYTTVYLLYLLNNVIGHPRNLAWNGGPLHVDCEHSAELFTHSGHVKENVIAIKAVTFKDEVYVISPRLKHGILATVWQVVRGRRGVELLPFPEQRDHVLAECRSIQNAVDFHLDHFGSLWVLDSGIIETLERPRCTCPPKVVVINILLKKLTRHIELSYLAEPTSLLQNIVVEYGIGGKPFVYISDASRGAVLVHDTSSDSGWTVLVCSPAAGLQLILVKRAPTHAVLVLVRLHQQGLLELDTATLRRKNALAPLRVFGDHTRPVLLLGSDYHHVYLRHTECADVFSWDTREAYNSTQLLNIHSPGPRLTPTSVTADPFKYVLLVLDSNYADTVHTKMETYHRITFIGQL